MSKRIFITGGTGLIGSRLVRKLQERGDKPIVLSRRAAHARQKFGAGVDVVEGDPMQPGPWLASLDEVDGVLHLAGEGIMAKRWNAAFKQLLVDSRIKSTNNIADALIKKPMAPSGQPKVLVNASAIGYYGDTGDSEVTEETPPGSDFLAKLCVDWEKAAQSVASAGARATQVRVGVVLDKEGGALAKLITPFKMFAGGPVGSGKQYMAWIHHEDMVNLFLFALDNRNCTGPLNGTAPNPETNKAFSKALGRAMHRPAIFPTPGFVLGIVLGEAAVLVTTGQKVLPKKPLSLGYQFKYPTIDAALGQIFAKG